MLTPKPFESVISRKICPQVRRQISCRGASVPTMRKCIRGTAGKREIGLFGMAMRSGEKGKGLQRVFVIV